MQPTSQKVVFVLENDAEVRASIGHALGSIDTEVVFFVRPAKCLEQIRSRKCDLLIVDSRIRGMGGADVVTEVVRLNPWIPVIAVIEQGDVTAAIGAMKTGAVDVLEKPLDEDRLKRRVESIIQENVLTNTCVGSPLTRVETRVLRLVASGKTNREMAHLLGRSVRTIEWHRANMMRKLGVDSLLGLIKRATALGILDLNGKNGRNGLLQ